MKSPNVWPFSLYLPHGPCGSGPQHCWGGGLGVFTCPAIPQGCGVALWAHCLEKHNALTSHHFLWNRCRSWFHGGASSVTMAQWRADAHGPGLAAESFFFFQTTSVDLDGIWQETWIFCLFCYPTWTERAQVWLEGVDLFIFFFRYLSVLMHNSNLISNTDAKLLHSIIIVVFNKLELLLQWKQCGRWDKSLFSLRAFSTELSEP